PAKEHGRLAPHLGIGIRFQRRGDGWQYPFFARTVDFEHNQRRPAKTRLLIRFQSFDPLGGRLAHNLVGRLAERFWSQADDQEPYNNEISHHGNMLKKYAYGTTAS